MTFPEQNYFAEIAKARTLLKTLQESKASAKTLANYDKLVRNMYAKVSAQAKIDNPSVKGIFPWQLVKAARLTTKVCTWNVRRAALLHVARNQVANHLAGQDMIQRKLLNNNEPVTTNSRWQTAVENATFWVCVIEIIRSDPLLPLAGREAKRSKRNALKELPKNWREELIPRLQTYQLEVHTQAVTGCRPDELVSGVHLRIEGDHLIARIKGSKVTTGNGQPWRELYYPSTSTNRFVAALVLMVDAAGGACTASVVEGRYSNALRAAGHRLYPNKPGKKQMPDITAYCFRHAAASDWKAGKLSSLQISGALGHCSEITKSQYGTYAQGDKKGVSPIRVETAREVRPNTRQRQRPEPKPPEPPQQQPDQDQDNYGDIDPGDPYR